MSKLIIYPSGKTCIRSQLTRALSVVANHDRLPYREPFVGGGIMTLHTLDFDRADSIWINDVDAPLMCFWQSVIEYPDLLLDYAESFVPSVEAWHKAKRICQKQDSIPQAPERMAEIGFLKLVVQRLSHAGRGDRSGSVRGGNRQDGPMDGKRPHRINSRWWFEDIRRQVLRYHKKFMRLDELRYTNLDFSTVIEDESERCVLFLDPPYWAEGPGTYRHSFTPSDHERLATLLKKTKHPWVLTYANHEQIRRLYDWAKIETVRVGLFDKRDDSQITWLHKKRAHFIYRTDLIITRS